MVSRRWLELLSLEDEHAGYLGVKTPAESVGFAPLNVKSTGFYWLTIYFAFDPNAFRPVVENRVVENC